MEEYENGLPPINLDLSNKKISNVNVNSQDYSEQDIPGIQSINIHSIASEKEIVPSIQSIQYSSHDYSLADVIGIKDITIASEPAGKNLVMFYL